MPVLLNLIVLVLFVSTPSFGDGSRIPLSERYPKGELIENIFGNEFKTSVIEVLDQEIKSNFFVRKHYRCFDFLIENPTYVTLSPKAIARREIFNEILSKGIVLKNPMAEKEYCATFNHYQDIVDLALFKAKDLMDAAEKASLERLRKREELLEGKIWVKFERQAASKQVSVKLYTLKQMNYTSGFTNGWGAEYGLFFLEPSGIKEYSLSHLKVLLNAPNSEILGKAVGGGVVAELSIPSLYGGFGENSVNGSFFSARDYKGNILDNLGPKGALTLYARKNKVDFQYNITNKEITINSQNESKKISAIMYRLDALPEQVRDSNLSEVPIELSKILNDNTGIPIDKEKDTKVTKAAEISEGGVPEINSPPGKKIEGLWLVRSGDINKIYSMRLNSSTDGQQLMVLECDSKENILNCHRRNNVLTSNKYEFQAKSGMYISDKKSDFLFRFFPDKSKMISIELKDSKTEYPYKKFGDFDSALEEINAENVRKERQWIYQHWIFQKLNQKDIKEIAVSEKVKPVRKKSVENSILGTWVSSDPKHIVIYISKRNRGDGDRLYSWFCTRPCDPKKFDENSWTPLVPTGSEIENGFCVRSAKPSECHYALIPNPTQPETTLLLAEEPFQQKNKTDLSGTLYFKRSRDLIEIK